MNDNLADIERRRWILAREAGDILARYFGGNLDIQYKDEGRNDPVTNADREVQDFLVKEIARGFPDHGILGEEDDEKKSDDRAPAPLYLGAGPAGRHEELFAWPARLRLLDRRAIQGRAGGRGRVHALAQQSAEGWYTTLAGAAARSPTISQSGWPSSMVRETISS